MKSTRLALARLATVTLPIVGVDLCVRICLNSGFSQRLQVAGVTKPEFGAAIRNVADESNLFSTQLEKMASGLPGSQPVV